MSTNPLSKILTLLLFTLFISACAGIQSSRDIVEGVNFEFINSDTASITNVYLHRTPEGMNLHGELQRKSKARGPIPGHLHVSLLDSQGKLIKSADVDYKRHNKQSNHSHFSIALPIKMESGSTIQITHASSERNDLADHPKWLDTAKH